MKALEDELGVSVKELARLSTQAEIMEGTIAEEEKKAKTLEHALVDVSSLEVMSRLQLMDFIQLRASLESQKSEVGDLQTSYASSKESHQGSQAKLAASEELLQTLVTGLSSTSNASSAGGYLGQLAEAKARLAAASTEEEQIRMRIGMIEKELKEKEAKWRAMEKEAGDSTKALERARKALSALTNGLQETGWNAKKEEEASRQLNQARDAVRSLSEVRMRGAGNTWLV